MKNQSLLKELKDPGAKLRDYHAILDVILTPLRELQKTAGIYWELPYRGHVYKVVFILPVMFVIGDTETHDKLVGKYSFRGSTNVARLCRYCDCPSDKTGDPHHKF